MTATSRALAKWTRCSSGCWRLYYLLRSQLQGTARNRDTLSLALFVRLRFFRFSGKWSL